MIEASLITDAYPDGGCADPPRPGESMADFHGRIRDDLDGGGDGLFTFIINELGEEDLDHEEAISRLLTAERELADVRLAIEAVTV